MFENSNTSHVTINRNQRLLQGGLNGIQIHLMLLLILMARPQIDANNRIQIHLMLLLIPHISVLSLL